MYVVGVFVTAVGWVRLRVVVVVAVEEVRMPVAEVKVAVLVDVVLVVVSADRVLVEVVVGVVMVEVLDVEVLATCSSPVEKVKGRTKVIIPRFAPTIRLRQTANLIP